MKNPEIAKVFEEIDNGTITLDEANKRLEAAGAPYRLNPWKNHIGRNQKGVGLLDTGTGTMDKVKVIEDENGIRLAEAVFDAEAFKGGPLPVANVQYEEKWYKVAEDGVTLK
jgi:hypothetical protein